MRVTWRQKWKYRRAFWEYVRKRDRADRDLAAVQTRLVEYLNMLSPEDRRMFLWVLDEEQWAALSEAAGREQMERWIEEVRGGVPD